MHPGREAGLDRVLGLGSVIGILIGSVIGSGIFIVPATIAAAVESPVLMLAVWVLGGVLSFFGALAFSELGAALPRAGGMYVFLREAYGRPVAFLFGWTLFLVIDSGAIATLSMAFASKYLPYFVTLTPVATKIAALVMIGALVVANYVGTRWGAFVQNTLTVVKFAGVVGVSLVVLALADGEVSHFVSPPVPPWSGGLVGAFGVALVAALWAYKGWESVTFSAGEMKDPKRDLPIGLFAGTLVVIGVYAIANVAYLWVFPAREIAASTRIAADAMQAAVGAAGASLVAGIILFSIVGAGNAIILTAPRVFFAMARDGLFLKSLARVHTRYHTPHVSIVATGVWASVLALSGTFEQLATYVVFGQWLFFGLTVAAVFVLRHTRRDLPRPYRTWGYPVTPALFILASAFIAVNTLVTQPMNALAGLGIIAIGIPAYLIWSRNRPVDQ
ncbi:MAG: amino acid permease [Acidobacteriota bacterium]